MTIFWTGLNSKHLQIDNKSNVAKIMVSVFDRVENVGRKRYSIFSFSHNVFKWLLSQGRLKSGLCGKKLNKLCAFYFCQLCTGIVKTALFF